MGSQTFPVFSRNVIRIMIAFPIPFSSAVSNHRRFSTRPRTNGPSPDILRGLFYCFVITLRPQWPSFRPFCLTAGRGEKCLKRPQAPRRRKRNLPDSSWFYGSLSRTFYYCAAAFDRASSAFFRSEKDKAREMRGGSQRTAKNGCDRVISERKKKRQRNFHFLRREI